MPTVETLLQELGKPPREICLDWAWQIRDLFSGAANESSTAMPPLGWSHLELDEASGLLHLRDVASENVSPEPLLQQLITWSEGDVRYDSGDCDPPPSTLPALSARLRQLTLADLQPQTEIQTSLTLTTGAVQSVTEPKVAEPEFTEAKVAKPSTISEAFSTSSQTSLRKQSSSARSTDERKRRGGSKSEKSKLELRALVRNPRILAVAGIVVGTIPLLLYLFLPASPTLDSAHSVVREATNASSATREATNANGHEHPGPAASPEVVNMSSSTSPLQITAPEPNPLAQFAENQLIHPQLSLPADPVSSNDLTPEVTSTAELLGSDSVAPNTDALATAPNAAPQQSQLDGGNSLPSAASLQVESGETTGADVMAEVVSASKSAGTAQSETELVVAADDVEIPEPLLLATSPAIQIQKLPPRLTPRPRQPTWRMTIGVDDEFKVTPQEPITLKEKEFASWTITSADAKAPRTSLLIGVQMSSGRQAALRWTIAAVSEDLPNLSLPLAEKTLQPLQDRLRLLSQLAPQEVERLKQLAASGVPSEVRTAINRERATLDAQGKLAARMLTFIASAQQLDAWLHSRITVFAELRDGAEADSTVVLRFGDIEQVTASRQAEASSEADAESEKPEPDKAVMDGDESPM